MCLINILSQKRRRFRMTHKVGNKKGMKMYFHSISDPFVFRNFMPWKLCWTTMRTCPIKFKSELILPIKVVLLHNQIKYEVYLLGQLLWYIGRSHARSPHNFNLLCNISPFNIKEKMMKKLPKVIQVLLNIWRHLFMPSFFLCPLFSSSFSYEFIMITLIKISRAKWLT